MRLTVASSKLLDFGDCEVSRRLSLGDSESGRIHHNGIGEREHDAIIRRLGRIVPVTPQPAESSTRPRLRTRRPNSAFSARATSRLPRHRLDFGFHRDGQRGNHPRSLPSIRASTSSQVLSVVPPDSNSANRRSSSRICGSVARTRSTSGP